MESADQPAEEMSKRHNLGRNYIGKVRIELCAKSFILQVYDVLARHSVCRYLSGETSHNRTYGSPHSAWFNFRFARDLTNLPRFFLAATNRGRIAELYPGCE
jgi:hypothetical protein